MQCGMEVCGFVNGLKDPMLFLLLALVSHFPINLFSKLISGEFADLLLSVIPLPLK